MDNQVFFYGENKMNSIRFDAVTSTTFFEFHANEPTLIVETGGKEQVMDLSNSTRQEQKQFMAEYKRWLDEPVEGNSGK